MIISILFFLYYLYPILLFLSGYYISYALFDMRKINIFGVMFVYVLLRSGIGIIYFIFLKFKYKKDFFMQNFYYIYPTIIFSVLILFSAIILITKQIYNFSYYAVYSVLILGGTFFWINSLLFRYEVNKILKIIYSILTPMYSSLLCVTGYIISIY